MYIAIVHWTANAHLSQQFNFVFIGHVPLCLLWLSISLWTKAHMIIYNYPLMAFSLLIASLNMAEKTETCSRLITRCALVHLLISAVVGMYGNLPVFNVWLFSTCVVYSKSPQFESRATYLLSWDFYRFSSVHPGEFWDLVLKEVSVLQWRSLRNIRS